MPYNTRKVRGKDCYKVYNTKSRKVFSNCTSKTNAIAQLKLLRAIQFNKKFVPLSKKALLEKRKMISAGSSRKHRR